MSLTLERQLRGIVGDFDALIVRCELCGLHEVSRRLQPIREAIQHGIELREGGEPGGGKSKGSPR